MIAITICTHASYILASPLYNREPKYLHLSLNVRRLCWFWESTSMVEKNLPNMLTVHFILQIKKRLFYFIFYWKIEPKWTSLNCIKSPLYPLHSWISSSTLVAYSEFNAILFYSLWQIGCWNKTYLREKVKHYSVCNSSKHFWQGKMSKWYFKERNKKSKSLHLVTQQYWLSRMHRLVWLQTIWRKFCSIQKCKRGFRVP